MTFSLPEHAPCFWMSLHLLLLRLEKNQNKGYGNQGETPWGQCQACDPGWLWTVELFMGKCENTDCFLIQDAETFHYEGSLLLQKVLLL